MSVTGFVADAEAVPSLSPHVGNGISLRGFLQCNPSLFDVVAEFTPTLRTDTVKAVRSTEEATSWYKPTTFLLPAKYTFSLYTFSTPVLLR